MARITTKARRVRLLYQAREGRAVSIQEVANATGISHAAISNLELGKTERINFDTLLKLCAFYGVGVGDILEYDPYDPNGAPGQAVTLATA